MPFRGDCRVGGPNFMKMLGIVQARMSSHRLPGKVLAPIAGKPLLSYLIDRLRRSESLQTFVIATSEERSDDPIADFCAEQSLTCVRGSLEDPSARIAAVLRNQSHAAFARICADSPFYDPDTLDQLISLFDAERYDLVTNVMPRSFPRGQSVEVVASELFLRMLPEFDIEDREHVTRYFYRSCEKFRIRNVSCSDGDLSSVNFCIDTPDDLRRAEQMVRLMVKPQQLYRRQELVDLYRQVQTAYV